MENRLEKAAQIIASPESSREISFFPPWKNGQLAAQTSHADEDDAISLFGDQQAGGIVLLQIFQNYFSGYTDDGNTEHLAAKT